MVRCPICTKIQVVYVKGPTRTTCYYCGTRWVQEGADQLSIIGLGSPPSALRSMRLARPTSEETR